MIAKQVEDFIPRLDFILPELKKIKLYDQESLNSLRGTTETFPGFRSLPLVETNPFLFEYINFLMFFNRLIKPEEVKFITHFIQLRLEEDNKKEFIHRDFYELASLVYLSETNLNSGTRLYDINKNIINDFKFVKNRLIMYSGIYLHMGYGHHGTDIENGRLTLNSFITLK
jgi:hypothetical protein|tara:strand:- start:1778 stop:2290 length:513 start_codon:yes stop_codon:yes gene_type:complete